VRRKIPGGEEGLDGGFASYSFSGIPFDSSPGAFSYLSKEEQNIYVRARIQDGLPPRLLNPPKLTGKRSNISKSRKSSNGVL